MHQFWIVSVLGMKMHNNRVGTSNNSPIFKTWKWQIIYWWSRTEVDRIYIAINLLVSLFPKNTNISVIRQNQSFRKCLYWIICHFDILGMHLDTPGQHFDDPEVPTDTQQDTWGPDLDFSRFLMDFGNPLGPTLAFWWFFLNMDH